VSPLRLDEYEQLARRHLPEDVFDYFAGGACDERTLADNRSSFDRLRLRGRVLRSVEDRSLETTVLGQRLAMPLMVAPVAFQRLAYEDGELATAKAAAAAGSLMILSTLATASIEEVAQVANGALWFQLYVYKDRGLTRELVRRAEQAGCGALVLTVDGQVWGRRERDIANSFTLPDGLSLANLAGAGHGRLPHVQGSGLAAYVASLFDPALSWDAVAWLAAQTTLPVVVKGILHADDARLAVAHGASAVFVSNHGGRQLDTAAATLDVLGSVVDAIDGRCEVYMDGGVRRGTDVVKALALGARAVAIGRPAIWGLAAAGGRGVARVLAMLREEIDIAMALCGASRPHELGRDVLL